MKKLNGLALAAATAIMLSGCNALPQKTDSVLEDVKAAAGDVKEATGDAISDAVSDAPEKCVGGNSCKGQSACQTANSACKGLNACKGQGFTMSSKADCDAAGGTTEK